MSKGQGKLLTNKITKVHKQNIIQGIFSRAYLGCSIETGVLKMSFYHNIVCQNVLCELGLKANLSKLLTDHKVIKVP